MILGGDQGAVISVDGLADHPTWTSWLNQPIAELYHVAPDYNFPCWVTGRATGQRRRARRARAESSRTSPCATGSRCAPAARPATPRRIR